MLVMFGNGANLFLAIIDSDIEILKAGRTLEYINPPHDPQLVKNIVVMHGTDKDDVIRQLRAGGIAESAIEMYQAGKRTDRGHFTN